MTPTNAATAREVSLALKALGFQCRPETLTALSQYCRNQFLEHVALCVAGSDPGGHARHVVDSLLRCYAPETVARLQALVPGMNPGSIATAALRVPARFLSAIEVASHTGHPRRAEAQGFLERVLAAPESAPERAPAAPPRSSPASEGKKDYESCHVYGSAYALCFNAGKWDGVPGVMVDAAIATGAKSYDWRNAVHLWLNADEVAGVLAVLRRWRKGVEFNSHGPRGDRVFSIEFQGQHFFAKVYAGKTQDHPARAVKIMPTQAIAVTILFLTQLSARYPSIPVDELLATVRAAHQLPPTDAAAA